MRHPVLTLSGNSLLPWARKKKNLKYKTTFGESEKTVKYIVILRRALVEHDVAYSLRDSG